MGKIILMAETGCDIPADEAARLGVELVPMHVAMGEKTVDDGTISPAEMLEECRQLGVLPKTSGCMPVDFGQAFDRVHAEHPDAQILHLAYSGVTTCSLESAVIAAEGRDYVTSVDTQHVTIGQGLVVTRVAEWLASHGGATVEEAAEYARSVAARCRMGFIPGDLGYLRAGGRLSNVAFLGATLLRIKPAVELVDGRLTATKKLRGKMSAASVALLDLLMQKEGQLDLSRVSFVYSPGLTDSVREVVEAYARGVGFEEVVWHETGDVITSHAGPGAFGVAFLVAE